MMKIYCIMAFAALIFGCQREENLATGEKGKITFSASLDGMAETRAVSAVDFHSYGIYIAGYHTEGKFAAAVIADKDVVYPNIFDYDKDDGQLPVPHVTQKDNKFVLSTVKWKLDQTSYLSYFAWTEAKVKDAVNGVVNAIKNKDDKGYPWIDIVNSSDYSKQVDVAAARHVDEKNYRVISAIDLNFKHILSKVTLKFKSSAGANVALSKMDLSYGSNMIFSKGRYTFNSNIADSIGHFSGLSAYHTGATSLGTTYNISGGAEVVVGDLLLIPQSVKQGFLVLDLTYTIASSGGTYTHNKQVLLPATRLRSGVNHIFTVDIYSEQIIVNQAEVSDWVIDATPRLPLVPGPKGDTQLLLDGYDKPYQHLDGKWYWLDRSGYNRHVEITGNNITSVHNASDHSYNFNGTTSMKASYSLGTVTALSLDMVLQTTTQTDNTIFSFTNIPATSRPFQSHYGWSGSYNNAIIFDSGGITTSTGRVLYALGADLFNRRMVSWQKKDGGLQQIYIDAGLVQEGNAYTTLNNVTINGIGGDGPVGHKGKIFYVKLTSKMNTIQDIVKTYQSCRIKYSIPINQTYLPTVQNGLIFCFDGRSGIKNVNSIRYWVDQIGKNDAQIIGNNITHSASESSFSMPSKNNRTQYMKMIFPVNMTNDFTAEFVLQSQDETSTGSPICWGPGEAKLVTDRYLYLSVPHSNGFLIIDSPGVEGYYDFWSTDMVATVKRKIVVRRKHGAKSEFFMSNKLRLSSQTGLVDKESFRLVRADIESRICDFMAFGGHQWGGRIYAVRYYDRALTDAEMKENYDFDVTTFKLTEK